MDRRQQNGAVMEFERFFKFSQLLLRDEFVLSYSGYVSEDILLAVGETLRARLDDRITVTVKNNCCDGCTDQGSRDADRQQPREQTTSQRGIRHLFSLVCQHGQSGARPAPTFLYASALNASAASQ